MTQSQIGCPIEHIDGAGQARWIGCPRQVMNWRMRLAALFFILALAGCAQGTAGQAGAPYPPYSPQNNENVPEHGGGNDGGGGGSM